MDELLMTYVRPDPVWTVPANVKYEAFCVWLDGFMAALETNVVEVSTEQMKAIRAKLDTALNKDAK